MAALLLSLVLLAGLTLMVRNAYGMLAAVTVAAAVALVLWRGSVAAAGRARLRDGLVPAGRRDPAGPGAAALAAPAAGPPGRTRTSSRGSPGCPAGLWVVLFALVAWAPWAVSGFWLVY